MKKKIFTIFAALILVVSCCSVGFADVPDYDDLIQPYNTSSISFVTSRTSATSADVSIYVHFSQQVDQYSVVVYLQKLSNGSWVLDTTNPDYVTYNNGFSKRYFLFGKTYSHLERGVTYRIKCVSKDYIGSASHIATAYSDPF